MQGRVDLSVTQSTINKFNKFKSSSMLTDRCRWSMQIQDSNKIIYRIRNLET